MNDPSLSYVRGTPAHEKAIEDCNVSVHNDAGVAAAKRIEPEQEMYYFYG
jgi:hypothetical protein